jgi:hypothetical protein
MGNKNSHQPAAPPVCENCHKSTQKPLPSTNTSNHDDANNGDDEDSQIQCMEQYEQVEDCMKQNKGQIVPCSNAWQIFKQCREQTTTTRVWSYYCTFDYILCDRNWNKKSAYWHTFSTESQDRPDDEEIHSNSTTWYKGFSSQNFRFALSLLVCVRGMNTNEAEWHLL